MLEDYELNLLELVDRVHTTQANIQSDYLKSSRRKARLEIIQDSLAIMNAFLTRLRFESDDIDALAIRGLVDRAYQTLEAVTILALGGFELPTLSLIRDIIEIEFLLRYFFKHPNEISQWIAAPRMSRMSRFSPGRLRREIAGSDRKLQDAMEADYLGHCEMGTHPTPISIKLQQSLSTEDLKELRIWFTIIEVAFHSEQIARWIGFLGIIIDPDKQYFRRRLNRLKRRSENLEADKKAASMLLGARLGRRTNWREIIKVLSKKADPNSNRGSTPPPS